jgi:SMC interacting uncharacterized protein involved in chromosome segregation
MSGEKIIVGLSLLATYGVIQWQINDVNNLRHDNIKELRREIKEINQEIDRTNNTINFTRDEIYKTIGMLANNIDNLIMKIKK